MEVNRNPKVGDRVIVRSNENEELMIGTLVQMAPMHNTFVPIVNSNNMDWWVGGIVIEHTDEIEMWLSNMTPTEQWNALSLNYKLE